MSDTPNAKAPANSVEAYAMPIVTSSILPAPTPVSAIAGATSPSTMKGTKNLMNCPNVPLKQLSARITQPGATAPITAPIAMARNNLGRIPILIPFLNMAHIIS